MQGEALIRGLMRPGVYAHATGEIELLETHCAWVLLTGMFVYKIKKPVNFGFLDFSTLEKRRHYCAEEVRLNRRFAPDIYLDVVAITGTPDAPVPGGDGEVLEYAVRMRQFPRDCLLSQLAARGELEAAHIDQLVDIVSAFHAQAARARADSGFGAPEQVHHWVRENFGHIEPLLGGDDEPAQLERVRLWSETAFERLRPVLAARRAGGFVRECHGDLHLGNITVIEARVVPFDCIEFNPQLRWIDVMSEVAFLLMDLEDRGQARFANRFLNAYLQAGGDYAGLAVFDYYRVYRAMVRAKVAVLRRAQTAPASADFAAASHEYRQYLALARGYIAGRRPVLAITRGLSGSGKSTLARDLCERSGCVQLRSDVERKRLAGLAALADSASALGGGLYSTARTGDTYARLEALAAEVLAAGYSVIVDATFLKQAQRARFAALAGRLAVPFLLIECTAAPATLEQRLSARSASGTDASEATLDVLRAQRRDEEGLSAGEAAAALVIETDRLSAEAAWERFQSRVEALSPGS